MPINFIKKLNDEKLLDEYSDRHILKKAINGNFDLFLNYPLIGNMRITFPQHKCNESKTFVDNLSIKLNIFSQKLTEDDFKKFIKNQLSAGKNNYKDSIFFSAASEVSVLNYLTFSKNSIKNMQYEPTFNGYKNPEARIEYKDDVIIDVEVKTADFQKIKDKSSFLKPLTIMKDVKEIKKFCKEKNVNFIFPQVMKLKDYIISAASKFADADNKKHFNLLFINWSYTNLFEVGLDEPLELLTNPLNGIFVNPLASEHIGISMEELKKFRVLLYIQIILILLCLLTLYLILIVTKQYLFLIIFLYQN